MMKRIILTILLAVAVLCACSAKGSKENESAAEVPAASQTAGTNGEALKDKDLSYAFGLAIGTDLQNFGIDYDTDEFAKGFKDLVEGNELRMTLDEAVMKIQLALAAIVEKRTAEAAEKEAAFFTENGKKAGVITTASGLQYEIITAAEGPKPTAEQTVVVNYSGTFTDGTQFDASQPGRPAEFPLNYVIPGWTEGIQLMSIGSKYRFYIPSALGYGPEGREGFIPPYAPLIFEVELLEIKDTDPAMFGQGF